MKHARNLTLAALALTLLAPLAAAHAQARQPETVSINAAGPATPFPHFWEQMFGSGHAILALRQSWRDDLRAVKSVTDFRWVRFHGILDDDVDIFTRDEHGNPVYNFSQADEIYDGMLAQGVRPLVELSFMPTQMAFNPLDLHVFWYHPNVSPPRSWDDWDALIRTFAQHMVNRYGIDEVSQWYFEVWNEPNIDFWGGIPRLQSYEQLYAHTARALKSVSPRLRVGGPATAAASWIPEFLAYVSANHVPIDFVSTHGYADDTVENLFHNDKPVPEDDRVCAAVSKVRNQIDASALPHLPLFWTEWNVQGQDESRDTPFVGPGLANTVRECDGKVNEMSFWTFSDVFQEGGPIAKPFEGHFGLRAKGGINKPSFYDFALLHRLGDQRLAVSSSDVLATKAKDGSLRVAAWNIVDPGSKDWGKSGPAKIIDLEFRNVPPDARVTIATVDQDHGNVLPKYRAMGSPDDPTPNQVEELNHETALPPPTETHLTNGHLKLTLTPNALDLVTVER